MVIAAALLVITLTAAGAETAFISAKADSLTARIEQIDLLVQQDNLLSAERKCRELEDDWKNGVAIIDSLIIHDYADSIGLSISKMRSYIENHSTIMYFAESTGAKKGLASVKESEYPFFENIL